MKKSIRRSALVAAAVGALVVGFVPVALAAVVNNPIQSDANAVVNTPATVGVFRIAGNTRIQTAIEAANVRTNWGRGPVALIWNCADPNSTWQGQPVLANVAEGGTRQLPSGVVRDPVTGRLVQSFVDCTAVRNAVALLDIIIARDDDYADALAASPLADVVTAPVLLNPTDTLNSDVKDEIAKLSSHAGRTTVHLLGGTNALSAKVRDDIAAIPGVSLVTRHQGVNRYETAVQLANYTIGQSFAVPRPAGLRFFQINAYLTTGVNFPDALSAGAAAANNTGLVLLTNGPTFDTNPSNFSFTFNYIANLQDTITTIGRKLGVPGDNPNTPEIFAVGGPAVTAADGAGVNLAARYNGVNRYETATLTAEGTFNTPFGQRNHFAVVSGKNYPDAVVASAFIANLDGPLLLSDPTDLTSYTAKYLQTHASNSDVVWTFGGPDTLSNHVTDQIKTLLGF